MRVGRRRRTTRLRSGQGHLWNAKSPRWSGADHRLISPCRRECGPAAISGVCKPRQPRAWQPSHDSARAQTQRFESDAGPWLFAVAPPVPPYESRRRSSLCSRTYLPLVKWRPFWIRSGGFDGLAAAGAIATIAASSQLRLWLMRNTKLCPPVAIGSIANWSTFFIRRSYRGSPRRELLVLAAFHRLQREALQDFHVPTLFTCDRQERVRQL